MTVADQYDLVLSLIAVIPTNLFYDLLDFECSDCCELNFLFRASVDRENRLCPIL